MCSITQGTFSKLVSFYFKLTLMYLGIFTENLQGQRLQIVFSPFQIFPRDLSCMTTMITFEYLIQLCQNKEQVCPLNSVKDAPGINVHHHLSPAHSHNQFACTMWCDVVTLVGEVPATTAAAAADDCIHTVPFQFDLMKLLPKCQQIELFFYTFSRGTTWSSIHLDPRPVLSYFHISLFNHQIKALYHCISVDL